MFEKSFYLKRGWLFLFISGLFSLMLGLSTPLFAADQEEDETDEFTLEEITVTAEKREAELQKVPLDVSVVRAEDLQELGITRAEELDEIIPELEIDSAVSSFMQVRVRGVQQSFWNPMFEMSTAIHVDGVQLTRTNNFNNMIYDMQRVEVLKGPQGTLYGRGAIGGTINIVTQKPILNEVSGNASLSVGNDNLRQVEGGINIPLAEKLAMRVAGRTVKKDGPTDSNMGKQDSWGSRFSLTWEPSEKDTFIGNIDLGHSETNGYSRNGYYFDTYGDLNIVPSPDPISEFQTITSTPADGPIEIPFQDEWASPGIGSPEKNLNDNKTWGAMIQWEHLFNFGYLTTVYGHRSMHEDKNYSGLTISASGTPPATYAFWGSTYVDYSAWPDFYTPLSEEVRIENGTNGRYWFLNPNNFVKSGTFISVSEYFSHSYNSSHTDSLETRLTSNASITNGDGYEWIAGLMLQDDELTAYNDSLDAPYWGKFNNVSQGYFFQGAWTPPVSFLKDKFIISAGFRKSIDVKKYNGRHFDSGEEIDFTKKQELDDDGNPVMVDEEGNIDADGDYYKYIVGDPRESYKIRWNKDTWKLNLSYFVTPSLLTYAQYALGYKAGSYSYYGRLVQPETSDTYEVGIKSQFFNNRLRVNLSGYYYKYKNYQRTASVWWCYEADDDHACQTAYKRDDDGYLLDENGDQILVGGDPTANPDDTDDAVTLDSNFYNYDQLYFTQGTSIQKGATANITWMATRKDTVSLNGTWSNNEYEGMSIKEALIEAYPDNPPDSAYSMATYSTTNAGRFGSTPYRGSISFSHIEMIGMDSLNANLRFQYEGRALGQTINYDGDYQYDVRGRSDYWVTNLSLSYGSSRWVPESMRWNLRLSVTNLTDSRYLQSISYSTSSTSYSGAITGYYIEPRKTTLSLSLYF